MKNRYYVTVQLTNGGIESVEIELDEDIKATYDIFKEYIDEYDNKNMDYNQLGLWSKGHILLGLKLNKYENSNTRTSN